MDRLVMGYLNNFSKIPIQFCCSFLVLKFFNFLFKKVKAFFALSFFILLINIFFTLGLPVTEFFNRFYFCILPVRQLLLLELQQVLEILLSYFICVFVFKHKL